MDKKKNHPIQKQSSLKGKPGKSISLPKLKAEELDAIQGGVTEEDKGGDLTYSGWW